MSSIFVQNLSFAYEGSSDSIFENMTLQLDTDWKLGFVGRNGKGKTTFLHLLEGKYPYDGKITASVDFEYFPFAITHPHEMTLNLVEEIYPEYIYWELVREITLLQLSEDVLYRPFESLSKGEQTKLLFAVLFLKDHSFLLIDEPTNHLDAEGRAVVARYLRQKKGFIIISHDRAFLDTCVDHILAITEKTIDVQQGNFSSWLANKEKQDAFELAQNQKLQGEIRRLEKSAREKASWSNQVEKTKYSPQASGLRPDRGFIGHKSEKMMRRSKSIEKRQSEAIEKKSTLLKNIDRADSLKISQLTTSSAPLLSVSNLSISYDDEPLFKPISFTLEPGEQVQLQGKNGSGKSSLIQLICEEPLDFSGTFHKKSGLKLSIVSQDSRHLKGSLANYAKAHSIEESRLKTLLNKLGLPKEQFGKDMEDFSDGQKKKVLLAASLCEESHLLIWDEPLNFIDVVARQQIEELLLTYKPTMLFVEHDQVFCEKIASKEIELESL